MQFVCDGESEEKFWTDIFQQVHDGTINSSCWDYQWVYSCWSQGGLAILPNINLVSNIGFGYDARHTIGESPIANLPTADI